MATSGYLHVASRAPSAFNNAAAITRPQDQRKVYFASPTNAGSLTHIDALLYKRGTPPSGAILFEIWQCKSGGNFFLDVVSGSNWDLAAVASLDPSSVTGINSWQNATWIRMPVGQTVYIDNWSEKIANETAAFPFQYALKIVHTAAASTADATNAIQFPFTNSHSLTFGLSARSTEVYNTSALDFEDLPFALYGLITTSSKYLDRPIGTFSQGSSFVNADLISSTSFRVAFKFTAIGSSITRAAIDTFFDGAVNIKFYASLWTHQVNSNLPNTCIGTSQLITINSQNGAAANFFNGDLDNATLAPMFILGSLGVTSGNNYWIAVEVQSHAYSATTKIAPAVGNNPSFAYAYWDARSTSAIFSVASRQGHFEVWYVDSETLSTSSADHNVPVGQTGALARNIPSTYQRRYPELINRKYPL